MNRIIKFRAWDLINKLMYYDGIVLDMGDCSRHSIMLDFEKTFKTTIPKTIYLMQFTGLHDKNGKEIYESDWIIMDLWNGGDGYTEPSEHDVFEGIVTWHEGGFGINTKPFRDTPEINLMSQSTYVDIEIIGNIYENPELLEEK